MKHCLEKEKNNMIFMPLNVQLCHVKVKMVSVLKGTAAQITCSHVLGVSYMYDILACCWALFP